MLNEFVSLVNKQIALQGRFPFKWRLMFCDTVKCFVFVAFSFT